LSVNQEKSEFMNFNMTIYDCDSNYNYKQLLIIA